MSVRQVPKPCRPLAEALAEATTELAATEKKIAASGAGALDTQAENYLAMARQNVRALEQKLAECVAKSRAARARLKRRPGRS